MSRWLRPEWREVWREWSTLLWTLAIGLSAVTQQFPGLLEQITGELPAGVASWITIGLGVLGLIAKFAPQRALQQQAEVRRRNGWDR